jgi:hypothetical protein
VFTCCASFYEAAKEENQISRLKFKKEYLRKKEKQCRQITLNQVQARTRKSSSKPHMKQEKNSAYHNKAQSPSSKI